MTVIFIRGGVMETPITEVVVAAMTVIFTRGGVTETSITERRSDGDFHHRGGGGSGDNFDVGRPMPDLVPVIKNENGNLAPTHQVLIGNLPHRMNQCDVYEFCQRCKTSPIHVEMKTMNYPPNPLISLHSSQLRLAEN
ncbi:hypothetical protein J6590_056361 [Homalodisca vitripennis]|nr:hypothetical protein J6590_056361 [Homalodisca vitripennis]